MTNTGETRLKSYKINLREFERLYYEMNHEELEVIQSMTGCKKPCNYLEYKFHGGSLPSSFNSGFPFVSLVSRTRFTSVEREELLYPSSTMVAEVGGILGLFLGVSFITVWDGVMWMRKNFTFFQGLFAS